MKSEGALKHFVWAFVFALLGYVAFYAFIEHRRTRQGPWAVVFTRTNALPELIVNQAKLGIINVQIVFAGAAAVTNDGGAWSFGQARPVPFEVPFGKCVFLDTTFLPGTVTLQLCGHELELLPRVLILDHEEHAWHSGELVQVP